MHIQQGIGLAAGLINFSGVLWYIRAMFWPRAAHERTRPQRVTWWLWAVIGVLIALHYYESGARQTIWLAISAVVGPLTVALLSIPFGQGGTTKTDRWCVALCIGCLLLRVMAVFAHWILILALIVDGIAAWPTLDEYRHIPDRGARAGWIMGGIGATLNFFVLERLDGWLLVQPVFLWLLHVVALYYLMRRTPARIATTASI